MDEELKRLKIKQINKENAEKRDEFNKKNYTLFSFRLSNTNDKYIINYLNELENRTDRIRSLLKQDLSTQLSDSNNKYRSYSLALNASDYNDCKIIKFLDQQKDPEEYIKSAIELKMLVDEYNNKI